MSAGKRVFFGFLATGAFLAAVIGAFLPVWSPDAGLAVRPFAGGGALRIAEVTPGGAAAKAGLKSGDIVDLGALSLYDRLALGEGGRTVRVPVRRGASRFNAVVRQNWEAASKPAWGVVVTILADSGYLVLIFLLLRKAVDRLDGRLLLYVLLAQIAISVAYTTLTRDPVARYVLGYFVNNGVAILVCYYLALFLALVPSRHSPHTASFGRLITLFTIGFGVAEMYFALAVLFPAAELVVFGVRMSSLAFWGTYIAVLLLIVAIIGDGLAHTGKHQRVQLQWISASLSVVVFTQIVRAVYYFARQSFTGVPRFAWVDAVSWPLADLALLGAAYAVLRHRLIDMELIVSRTAVFTAVSAVLVVIFVALEWLGTIVAERILGNFGSAAAYSGIGAALIVGLSARPVHAAVEGRLNRLFFRRQARNEAALRRFARECEVATDAERLMDSAFTTLSKHVEGTFVAILVRENSGFRCVNSTFPLSRNTIEENEPLALRLRRFAEPFELDDPGTEFHLAMFVPVTVLGRVIAFIVCGAKPDRARYTDGETDVLAQFAQRVGTAYVLLREKREIWVPAEVG